MCGTCGCQTGATATVIGPEAAEHEHRHPDGTRHRHSHPHAHVHAEAHAHAHTDTHGHARRTVEVSLETRILAKNDAIAARNRAWFAGREILALNLVGAPGAGKTALLERIVRDLGRTMPMSVIEGDQATLLDAERVRAAGARVVQINTGAGCHLDAEMVAGAISELRPPVGSLVLIENVGNLVCPALFDLGEWAKIAVFSVPEGEDKPLKYPHMFRAAKLMLLNKIDLLPHLRFAEAEAIANAGAVNPDIAVLRVSAATGEGLPAFYDILRAWSASAKAAAFAPSAGG